ncbi:MAG: methyltransferase domain-containing protein [Pseudonocardiaceae bacterium]|nr:methyltransferase domain-containing protein [Pseudonocardiaceae bacterium]
MAQQESAKTRRAFDAAAADFTALGRYLWRPIGADTVEVADPRPGQRVLDACCGTGASAIPAARRVGRDGVVDAVDVSASMVSELRRLAGELPQLRACQEDVTAWQGAGYDVVQSALGIFFFPDMAAGTRRLIGMARPGGRVVFTIWRGDAMAAAGRHLGLAVAEATATDPPAEREPHLFDRINQAGTFAEWLTELGLSDVDVTVRDRWLTMTPEVAWLVVLGSGYRGALTELTPETVGRVREIYLSRLRDAGIVELDATTLIGAGIAPAAA